MEKEAKKADCLNSLEIKDSAILDSIVGGESSAGCGWSQSSTNGGPSTGSGECHWSNTF